MARFQPVAGHLGRRSQPAQLLSAAACCRFLPASLLAAFHSNYLDFSVVPATKLALERSEGLAFQKR
jgi:hypothetical protein